MYRAGTVAPEDVLSLFSPCREIIAFIKHSNTTHYPERLSFTAFLINLLHNRQIYQNIGAAIGLRQCGDINVGDCVLYEWLLFCSGPPLTR